MYAATVRTSCGLQFVGVGWDENLEGAQRFATLGQRDDAMYTAMGETVGFLESIGNAKIEARVRQLATALRTGILASVESAELVTPDDPALNGGVVVFSVAGMGSRSRL